MDNWQEREGSCERRGFWLEISLSWVATRICTRAYFIFGTYQLFYSILGNVNTGMNYQIGGTILNITVKDIDVCGSSTAIALGFAGSGRQLELVATDNSPIFGATSAHQWTSCCAEAAPVAPNTSQFFRRNKDVTAPARIFNMLNICLHRALVATKRKRRNGRSKWTSWHVVGGGCRKLFERKV